MITVNRDKAELIAVNRLRIMRDAKLAELDIAYIRAIEMGGDAALIAKEKQALRDLPDKDYSSLSVEDLGVLTLAEALKL